MSVLLIALTDWDETFRTYASFATMLNDMAFDDYHLFRAETRVLTDFRRRKTNKSIPMAGQPSGC